MQIIEVRKENQSNVSSHVGVFRAVNKPEAMKTKTYDKQTVYLNDGTNTHKFACSIFAAYPPTAGKLYEVTYDENYDGERRYLTITGFTNAKPNQIAATANLTYEDASITVHSLWFAPLFKVKSLELIEVMQCFQKILERCEYLDMEAFTIAKPSTFCDFHTILHSVDRMSFSNQFEKETTVAGVYLFCVFKSYHVAYEGELKLTDFDEFVLKSLESMLEKVAEYNPDLVRYLSDFIAVSGIKDSDHLTVFCANAVMVKDLYDSTLSELLWHRQCMKLRREAGLEY